MSAATAVGVCVPAAAVHSTMEELQQTLKCRAQAAMNLLHEGKHSICCLGCTKLSTWSSHPGPSTNVHVLLLTRRPTGCGTAAQLLCLHVAFCMSLKSQHSFCPLHRYMQDRTKAGTVSACAGRCAGRCASTSRGAGICNTGRLQQKTAATD